MCRESDGVMVTQRPLEALFMVQIHVGLPISRGENERIAVPDMLPTHQTPESGEPDMSRWPKKMKHRNKVLPRFYPLPATA